MLKYTAQELIRYATSLADLENSSFISWGDNIRLVNRTYRELYNDMITNGDQSYVQEVRLLSGRNSTYDLPEDFYQLASLTDSWGNDVYRLDISDGIAARGYALRNNQLIVQNVDTDLIMRYYPVPETITYKPEDVQLSVSLKPVAWNNYCLNSSNNIYNFKTQATTTVTGIVSDDIIDMGNGWLISSDGHIYDWSGTGIAEDLNYNIYKTPDGNYETIVGTEKDTHLPGVCNEDKTVLFYWKGGSVYSYNRVTGKETLIVSDDVTPLQYLYWNGKHAAISKDYICYEDGTWESTDNSNSIVLAKTDTRTGYGTVCKSPNGYYLKGWTPNTVIDYPNNILFDLNAYKLAIAYRMKQNAPIDQLNKAYTDLRESYTESLSQDGNTYNTIRNVCTSRWYRYI